MNTILDKLNEAQRELILTTSRSGGSGGQHVNKVETKVTLKWHIESSEFFDDKQKLLMLEKLINNINNIGYLVLYHQTARSQVKNKEKVIAKWKDIVIESLKVPKKRKASKPSKAVKAKIRKAKEKRSHIKKMRSKVDLD